MKFHPVSPGQHGSIELLPDGRFKILRAITVGQTSTLTDCSFHDGNGVSLVINKKPGEGQPMSVEQANKGTQYRYSDGQWFHAT
jgi:hypothetical protein